MGIVRSPLVAPHLYFALTRNLLYIGETQKHPTIRWGLHLAPEGSLRKALQVRGDPEIDYYEDIQFFGFRCTEIEQNFPLVMHRVAAQAAEHEAHCLFAERTHQFKIISDTVRTAPRKFNDREQVRAIAARAVDAFLGAI